MEIVASLEAVALVTVVVLLLRHFNAQASAWADERRELLNRIQAPSRLPLQDASLDYVIPERPLDEWAKVGQVDIDDDYGLED